LDEKEEKLGGTTIRLGKLLSRGKAVIVAVNQLKELRIYPVKLSFSKR